MEISILIQRILDAYTGSVSMTSLISAYYSVESKFNDTISRIEKEEELILFWDTIVTYQNELKKTQFMPGKEGHCQVIRGYYTAQKQLLENKSKK